MIAAPSSIIISSSLSRADQNQPPPASHMERILQKRVAYFAAITQKAARFQEPTPLL